MRTYIFCDGAVRLAQSMVEVSDARRARRQLWVDLETRTSDTDLMLTRTFGLHPLVVDDIWHDSSNPKIDAYDGYTYLVAQGPRLMSADERPRIRLWSLDIVFSPDWVITHHDDPELGRRVGERVLREPKLLAEGAGWLVHALLDDVVDRFLPLVDAVGERIDALELAVIDKPVRTNEPGLYQRIAGLKRSIQELCRITVPQRELLVRLAGGRIASLPKESLPYFRDVADHFVRVAERAETFRDIVVDVRDAYLGVQSNRMNATIKTLTLISTVMLPLELIASICGMSFHDMPGLDSKSAYWVTLGLMGLVALAIPLWFRRRHWV